MVVPAAREMWLRRWSRNEDIHLGEHMLQVRPGSIMLMLAFLFGPSIVLFAAPMRVQCTHIITKNSSHIQHYTFYTISCNYQEYIAHHELRNARYELQSY